MVELGLAVVEPPPLPIQTLLVSLIKVTGHSISHHEIGCIGSPPLPLQRAKMTPRAAPVAAVSSSSGEIDSMKPAEASPTPMILALIRSPGLTERYSLPSIVAAAKGLFRGLEVVLAAASCALNFCPHMSMALMVPLNGSSRGMGSLGGFGPSWFSRGGTMALISRPTHLVVILVTNAITT